MSRAAQLIMLAERDRSNPVLLCDLLDTLLAEGRVNDAWVQLQAAPLELRATDAVRFREARCAMQRQDYETVVVLLSSMPAAANEIPAGIGHDLAYAQFALGASDDALRTLNTTIAQGEDAVAVALLRARILFHQRLYREALAALEPIAASSRMGEVEGLRALLWLDLGDAVSAKAAATLALRIDPNQREAAIAMGTVALWDHQFAASASTFEQVLAVDPSVGRALLGLGQSVMAQGNVPVARALLERAVAAMPEHLGSWHVLAWCQLLEGDLAGAKRSFDKSFAVDRTFGETHGGLALVAALRGERKTAEESIKRAMRLDPAGRSARYAQSVLLLDEGQPEAAQRIIDDLMSSSSQAGLVLPADFIYRLRELVRPRG